MYERFSDAARKAMQLANRVSQELQHEYIGTEHIMLGMLKEGSALTLQLLSDQKIDPARVEEEIRKAVKIGDQVVMGKLPQTPRAKKVIEYAMEEAQRFNHDYVGVEHLVLGCLRAEDGIARQVLENLGMKLDLARESVETHVDGQDPSEGLPVVQRLSATSVLLTLGKTGDRMRAVVNLLDAVGRYTDEVGGVTAILVMGQGETLMEWNTNVAIPTPPEEPPAGGKHD
jgi:ATP-dependent Clp protease ATP-binding subunit ClpA